MDVLTNRNTGKTFRRIMTALISASNGENVIVISGTVKHRDQAVRLAIHTTINISGMLISQNFIRFPSGGNIKFCTCIDDRELRGKSYTIITDNNKELINGRTKRS